MANPPEFNRARRNLLIGTAAAGGVATVAAAVPFVESMQPSERAKALGAPVEADISRLAPGQLMTVEWRGKPVWILKRTPEMLGAIQKANELVADPKSDVNQQPADSKNEFRSERKEILVAVGICTHLGCSPTFRPDLEMFYCPCHGSKFDLAGRVYKGVPAPTNLIIPPYVYLSDNTILVGSEKSEG